MNFKKLQAMQAKLDEAILADKAPMTAEERFNKTLVALSVEIAEVANCAEHFKFWKDDKGKVDEGRFELREEFYNWDFEGHYVYVDKSTDEFNLVTEEQAHRLTLIEECSDVLHFILSLANQLKHEISNKFLEPSILYVVEAKPEKELLFLEILHYFSRLDRKQRVDTFESLLDTIFMYIISLGVTTQELEQAYYDKNRINYNRLENGY